MKLAVALCTYNGERFLSELLASIAQQTRLPDELVICDDASQDRTWQIVSQFAEAAHFPVRVYFNEYNLGSTANFQKAIQYCQADIIALADQDDVWLPHKLACFEETFRENDDVELAFTDAELVDQALQPLGYSLWDAVGCDLPTQQMIQGERAFYLLLQRSLVTGAVMAFRSRMRHRILPIPESWVHDGWIALNIAAAGQLLPIPDKTILYRQHTSNQIGMRRKSTLSRIVDRHLRDASDYQAMAAQADALREHLRRQSPRYEAFEKAVQDKSRHFRARAALPGSRAHRLNAILRELGQGRYHQYSAGIRSAVKDLLRV